MPDYLLNSQIWIDLYPIPLMAGLTSILLAYLLSRKSDRFWQAFSIIFAVSLLGITAGQIMGQSREPAVSAVMPAILSMIAGILVYIVSSKTVQQQMLVSFIIIGFTVNLLVGTFWGAQVRYRFEKMQNSEEMLLYKESISQNIKLQKLKYEKQLEEAKKFLWPHKDHNTKDYKVSTEPNK